MQTEIEANKIALIEVPSSAGARHAGQELAPQKLRDAGLAEGLRERGHELLDLTEVAEATYEPDTEHPTQQNLSLVLRVTEQVTSSTDSALAQQAWPLVIGGDCTITIGVVAALSKRFERLGLLYLDGDLDLNTPDTTSSGILDGMVLAHLLGKGSDRLSRTGPKFPLMEEADVTLFGYSPEGGGIDPVEIELLRETKMAKYPLDRISGDVRSAAERALRELEAKVDHILIHFDVDVIDADDFPAVDVPHQPGLRLSQAQEALEIFLTSRKAVGLVVTEFNAKRDEDGKLARLLAETIQSAVARRQATDTDDRRNIG